MNELSIGIAQINPKVGDIFGNIELLKKAIRNIDNKPDLVVTGELAISGYPPEDLVLKPSFIDLIEKEVGKLASETKTGPALLLGTPWREEGKLYNAALLLKNGVIENKRFKHHLPTYGVFDEDRVFDKGEVQGPIDFNGVRLGVMICEDMWSPDIPESLQEMGAEILIALNGSPFEIDKMDRRMNLAVARVTECNLPLVYVNLVGGQDELVFDGSSFVLNSDRNLKVLLQPWESQLVITDWKKESSQWLCMTDSVAPELKTDNEKLFHIYQAMILGLRDYVSKNNFPGIVLGLSGGIDSALSAAIAVDAIGPAKVHCVMMPSPYTSDTSIKDALQLTKTLGINYQTIPINDIMSSCDKSLLDTFAGTEKDTAEENIQSRIRGLIIMSISNKFGYLALTTGNKSEMSVGYATLYGDMCGGFSVLKDLYKTTIFDVCRWRNLNKPPGSLGKQDKVIADQIIEKKPSAELRPNQFDEDSLPKYEILDDILKHLVEGESAIDEVVDIGHEEETVRRIWKLLDRAEYKRRQAPPGVKISSRAFGKDRRYPITNGYSDLL